MLFTADDNDENNYEEDEDAGIGFFDNDTPGVFRIAPNVERDEEVLMIHYSDPDLVPEQDSISRMVHWNPNGLQLPFGLFDENVATNNDVTGKILLISFQHYYYIVMVFFNFMVIF